MRSGDFVDDGLSGQEGSYNFSLVGTFALRRIRFFLASGKG